MPKFFSPPAKLEELELELETKLNFLRVLFVLNVFLFVFAYGLRLLAVVVVVAAVAVALAVAVLDWDLVALSAAEKASEKVDEFFIRLILSSSLSNETVFWSAFCPLVVVSASSSSK